MTSIYGEVRGNDGSGTVGSLPQWWRWSSERGLGGSKSESQKEEERAAAGVFLSSRSISTGKRGIEG